MGNAQAGAPHQLLARVGLDDPGQEGDVLLAFKPNIDDLVELKKRNSVWLYSQTCLQRPPLGPKKSGRCQSWPVFTGFSIEIGIKSSLAGVRLTVVDRWPLFRGSR